MKLPKAESANIVVQNLRDETLVYNLSTDQAICLNDTAAKVFNACDGVTTFDELKAKHQFTDEIIYLALAELAANDLLVDYQSKHFGNLSRHEVVKKVGLASMVALPLVASIVAPSAANAASGRGTQANNTTCTTVAAGNSNECQSGNCVDTLNGSRITTLRCCAAYGIANNPPGFSFPGTGQDGCMTQAQNGICCSGAATYSNANGGTCTCT